MGGYRLALVFVFGATACSEYTVKNKDDARPGYPTPTAPLAPTPTMTTVPTVPGTATPTATSTAAPTPTPAPTPTAVPTLAPTPPPTPLPITCASFSFDWDWIGSLPFDTEPDPRDGSNRPWYAVDYDETGFSTIVVPDQNIPVGFDRIYRTTFTLADFPPSLALNVQSDDGIRIYVNGTLLGQYGGLWQVEGCVNEQANCINTTSYPPQDISSLLQVGPNTIAARVSNPVANAWFELIPVCTDN